MWNVLLRLPILLVVDYFLSRCKCSRFVLYLLYVAEYLNTLVDKIFNNITLCYITTETHNIHLSPPRWANIRQTLKTPPSHAKHVVHIFVYTSRILEKQLKRSRRCISVKLTGSCLLLLSFICYTSFSWIDHRLFTVGCRAEIRLSWDMAVQAYPCRHYVVTFL